MTAQQRPFFPSSFLKDWSEELRLIPGELLRDDGEDWQGVVERILSGWLGTSRERSQKSADHTPAARLPKLSKTRKFVNGM
jgi:hypothetical protein